MRLRRATADDVDAIADIVQDQRVRAVAWDPDYWSQSPRARTLDPMFLRRTVDGGRAEALVVEDDTGTIAGVGTVAPLRIAGAEPTTWLVDRLEVARPATWATLGPVLLAALGDRAVRHGAERLVVGCPADDRARRAALAGAGLVLDCWYRHGRLDEVTSAPSLLGDEPGLPLPRLHALSGLTGSMESVTAAGAHALLSPSVHRHPLDPGGGRCGLADPVIAAHDDGLRQVIDALEDRCRARGDRSLLVAVSIGEEPLDRTLEARGYRRPVEWWTWSPRDGATHRPGRRSDRAGDDQLQPLVEPHSWHT